MTTPARPRRRVRFRPEEVEQRALVYWAEQHVTRYPELRWLFAVPNQRGTRKPWEMGILSAMGVKPGVCDLILPVRAPFPGTAPGAVVEVKAPGELGRTSPEQQAWLQHFANQGWAVAVCDHWQDAWVFLMIHLGYNVERPAGGR